MDWRIVPEEDRLYFRMKEWWESFHLSFAHNTTMPPVTATQYGGTALFSIGSSAHRVIEKGCDSTNLGRWTWTRYRGKNNHTLLIITAYRPNVRIYYIYYLLRSNAADGQRTADG